MQQILADFARQNWAETAKQAVAVISALIALFGVIGGAVGNLGSSSGGNGAPVTIGGGGGGKPVAGCDAVSLRDVYLRGSGVAGAWNVKLQGREYGNSIYNSWYAVAPYAEYAVDRNYTELIATFGNEYGPDRTDITTKMTVYLDGKKVGAPLAVRGSKAVPVKIDVSRADRLRVEFHYYDASGRPVESRGAALGTPVLCKK
ncbi:hypothetical protein C1Y63_08860 [Corynebacterium sp. 13CS0277]|nr:hypothetical protein C1Y63_08860 [Corynebacterium sp. 13CS0277]